MKYSVLICFLFDLFSILHSQKLNEIWVPFEHMKRDMSSHVKESVDLAWDELKPSQQLVFELLSKNEQKLKRSYQIKLSQMRADSLITYLHRNRVRPEQIQIKIITENKKRTNLAQSNASYRNFTKQNGIVSFIVEKPVGYARNFSHSDSALIECNCYTEEFYLSDYNQFFYAPQGSVLIVPQKSFAAANHNSKEPYILKICEFLSMDEIVASGLTTLSNSKRMETGGMVFWEVYHQGRKVSLRTTANVQLFIPNEVKKKGMRVFEGRSKERLVNWNQDKNGDVAYIEEYTEVFIKGLQNQQDEKNPEVYDGDGVMDFYSEEEGWYPEVDGYLMKINDMGWINCDRFIDEPTKEELFVYASTDEKLFYRMVFKDEQSILPGYTYNSEGDVKFNDLPSNKEVYILAFGITKDKKAFLGYKEITTGEDKKVDISVQNMSIAEMQTALKNLFDS